VWDDIWLIRCVWVCVSSGASLLSNVELLLVAKVSSQPATHRRLNAQLNEAFFIGILDLVSTSYTFSYLSWLCLDR
jgi:dolichyl-phosphate-mannose--protein O-mannosyl transferase